MYWSQACQCYGITFAFEWYCCDVSVVSLRVGYFISASSMLYIVLVAWLLKSEPVASDPSKAAGESDGSLARQVRHNARLASLAPKHRMHAVNWCRARSHGLCMLQPVAMTKIAHQLWRSRAWVMQYIGFINNFALAILQYFLPIYCLVSCHRTFARASLHLPTLLRRRTPGTSLSCVAFLLIAQEKYGFGQVQTANVFSVYGGVAALTSFAAARLSPRFYEVLLCFNCRLW